MPESGREWLETLVSAFAPHPRRGAGTCVSPQGPCLCTLGYTGPSCALCAPGFTPGFAGEGATPALLCAFNASSSVGAYVQLGLLLVRCLMGGEAGKGRLRAAGPAARASIDGRERGRTPAWDLWEEARRCPFPPAVQRDRRCVVDGRHGGAAGAMDDGGAAWTPPISTSRLEPLLRLPERPGGCASHPGHARRRRLRQSCHWHRVRRSAAGAH